MPMKDIVSIHDLAKQDLLDIIGLTTKIKSEPLNSDRLKGKALSLIFEKPSNRTRVSFEVGMFQLGGHAVSLSAEIAKREEIGDVGKTLSRYVNGIMIRTFEHKKVVKLAEAASVPVINGLSDLLHPCQALADVFTIKEKKGFSKELKIAYVGDGNNVCHSLMLACAKVGLNITVATPKQYKPSSEILHQAMEDCEGSEITFIHDPVVAAKDADVIYTDVWTSMGQEKENKARKKIFQKFQLNKKLVNLAKPDHIIMHCLPAHRGDEITNEVMDSKNSVVFDQAENRLHVQKAILCLLLGGK